MRDGHFNRSFLPHGDFASGVRVGRASERALCVSTLAELLANNFPNISEEDKQTFVSQFKSLVVQREK